MKQSPDTIPKAPALKPAEDYFRLRREGIGFIEQMGSRWWTDYNTHDPGITILEALCYAITDIAYRCGWNIKDILAPPSPPVSPEEPYPDQPFFTARNILTINPWTSNDFRCLLIDLNRVRNAWVFCKECACDLHYYAWCEDDQLKLAYQKSPNSQVQSKKVEPLGLYEVLIELEPDMELSDLNDRKIEYSYAEFDDDGRPHLVTMELRFPKWDLGKWNEYELFLDSTDAFQQQKGAFFDIKDPLKFKRSKVDDTTMTNDELRKRWRDVFYINFEITLQPEGETLLIENAALRIYGDTAAKSRTTIEKLEKHLKDKSSFGFIQRYRNKLIKVNETLKTAKESLLDHRNLCEDYCHVKGVDVEDVAACADVEVDSDADIDRVQAEIWFEIEQYFNPPVPFYTLQELMDAGIPVEEIFNGPALEHGFIKAEDLNAAELKTVLRTSDIVNRLMKIKGVTAINNLQLTKYDSEGNIVKGAADPTWDSEGKPIFDTEKVSASWLLYVSELHQPRLYHNQSRFFFYQNGLPFLPRMDEVNDTLTQLRGETERPKIKNASKDLPIPSGNFRNPEDYFPVQYSFPLTYGIGTDGLPSHVSNLRRAQAMQLKAYLMVFEQILGNAFAQLAHTADLFSLDSNIKNTYFVHEIDDTLIKGYSDIVNCLYKEDLEGLTETETEFQDRRNRFLDHIMARFGEQFSEYSLILTNLPGRKVALDQLIDDKISFLKAYPGISKNKGKATNYIKPPTLVESKNESGFKKRISLFLGYPDLTFHWKIPQEEPPFTVTNYELKDQNDVIWMAGKLTRNITDRNKDIAAQKAFEAVIPQMRQPEAYQHVKEGDQYRLLLKDENGKALGQCPKLFDTESYAQAFRDELLNWSINERVIIVEHLLLRPKFPGDALYPACSEGACNTCGDEDPYSFRLTFVMPGWISPYDTNLEARSFAERTIRQEIPSNLLGKICWVGNEAVDLSCDSIRGDLAKIIQAGGVNSREAGPTFTEACDCADIVYGEFLAVFLAWFEGKELIYVHTDFLKKELDAEFNKIDPNEIGCTIPLDAVAWVEIKTRMVVYFDYISRRGMQFDRFENAWDQWRAANAGIDWTNERLQERVQAILERNLEKSHLAGNSIKDELCKCAAAIVAECGMDFHDWMDTNLKAGLEIDKFPEFTLDSITLCTQLDFKEGTEDMIKEMLQNRYSDYKTVSYHLTILVNLLSELNNIYPGATLHDCDEGGDRNPVRLGTTALGNYPLNSGGPVAQP